MDLCAELTLHVLRFLQQDAAETPFSGRWSFVPSLQTASWPEAQRLLAEATKPLIVAPLLEPGFLGTWSVDSLDGHELAAANNQLSNQQKYFEAKIEHFALDDADSVRFSGGETSLSFLVSDLRRWLREYAICARTTLDRSANDPQDVHLFVRRADGGWSPGMTERSAARPCPPVSG